MRTGCSLQRGGREGGRSREAGGSVVLYQPRLPGGGSEGLSVPVGSSLVTGRGKAVNTPKIVMLPPSAKGSQDRGGGAGDRERDKLRAESCWAQGQPEAPTGRVQPGTWGFHLRLPKMNSDGH